MNPNKWYVCRSRRNGDWLVWQPGQHMNPAWRTHSHADAIVIVEMLIRERSRVVLRGS